MTWSDARAPHTPGCPARRFIPLLGSALVLAACGDAPTTPSSPSASGIRQQALARTVNETTPFATAGFVSCANGGAGEEVILRGEEHLVGHETFAENGSWRFMTHIQTLNASGVEVTTGDRYRFVSLDEPTIGIEGALPCTFSSILVGRLVGQGPDDNFLLRQTSRTTINANGGATVLREDATIECRWRCGLGTTTRASPESRRVQRPKECRSIACRRGHAPGSGERQA